MKAKDLIKGRRYRYSGSGETEPVTFMYEALNHYVFSGLKNNYLLHMLLVENYIEEIEAYAEFGQGNQEG